MSGGTAGSPSLNTPPRDRRDAALEIAKTALRYVAANVADQELFSEVAGIWKSCGAKATEALERIETLLKGDG